jgi:hypothetical protein
MAYVKLQVNRTLDVVPSDTIGIPNPATKSTSGTTTSLGSGSNDLIDSAASFTTTVSVGDIVHDETNGVIDTVSAIVDDNNLTLTSGTAIANSAAYTIYREATTDAAVYVGVSGNLEIVDAAGQTTILTAVPVGWQPVNVKQIKATNTTATNIVAGW